MNLKYHQDVRFFTLFTHDIIYRSKIPSIYFFTFGWVIWIVDDQKVSRPEWIFPVKVSITTKLYCGQIIASDTIRYCCWQFWGCFKKHLILKNYLFMGDKDRGGNEVNNSLVIRHSLLQTKSLLWSLISTRLSCQDIDLFHIFVVALKPRILRWF